MIRLLTPKQLGTAFPLWQPGGPD